MISKKYLQISLVLAALLAGVFWTRPAQAQDGYTIKVNRDFGYGGFNNDIRGNFSISIAGDTASVAKVTYTIDGQEMSTLDQAPFVYKFVTSQYADGVHDLGAVITLKDGSTVTPAAKTYTFVSASQEGRAMTGIVFPIIGVVVLVVVITMGAQIMASRKRPASPDAGIQHQYGIAGGSICPKCGRPTPLHMSGLNWFTGKFDRCENCGKWSVMRRVPIDKLRAAEAAEAEMEKTQLAPEKSEEEKLREMLDKSKYVD